MHDLANRIVNRPIQLTTDGHKVYLQAVESAFNEDINYTMLSKIYSSNQAETRYSPAVCIRLRNEDHRRNARPEARERRVHQTLRVTPAMQVGLADHVWEIDEIVGSGLTACCRFNAGAAS